MPMIKKKLPTFEGEGQVRFTGYEGPTRYVIEGDPTRLRQGRNSLRGSLVLTPDLAADAFRAGEAMLTTDTGARFRLVMLGHSAGGAEVFVELRV